MNLLETNRCAAYFCPLYREIEMIFRFVDSEPTVDLARVFLPVAHIAYFIRHRYRRVIRTF